MLVFASLFWNPYLMCGRYYRTEDKQQIAEAFRAEATGDPLAYAPGYNIAPTTIQPIIRQARETFKREIVPMRWGLVGYGAAKIDPKRNTFNARAEGLADSGLWKRPLHRHRCIVPISGFYEWRKPERTAFRFTVKDQPLFGLAGLWDAWKAPDETWLQSFTIITTDPNVVCATIHDRMPVILQPKDFDEWLNREEVERPPVHLFTPVQSIRYAGPSCPSQGGQRPKPGARDAQQPLT